MSKYVTVNAGRELGDTIVHGGDDVEGDVDSVGDEDDGTGVVVVELDVYYGAKDRSTYFVSDIAVEYGSTSTGKENT